MDWRTFFVTAILLGAVDGVLFWQWFYENKEWPKYPMWVVNLPAMPIALAIADSVHRENDRIMSAVWEVFAVRWWGALLGLWTAWRRRRRTLRERETETTTDDTLQHS
jgi:hypothetical protein